ncbi:MAG: hypothetical protein E6924_12050 [Cutibacterium avidum]|nr:hypothetical protein [Cutibacterium avidum]
MRDDTSTCNVDHRSSSEGPMLEKSLISVLIGVGISVVAFVPVLIHQFRRFGAPSLGRMVLIFTNFVLP